MDTNSQIDLLELGSVSQDTLGGDETMLETEGLDFDTGLSAD